MELCFGLTAKILPVVQNQHLLLCTLLICNAAAMEVSNYDSVSFEENFLALVGYPRF